MTKQRSLQEIINTRIRKIKRLKEMSIDPYPTRAERTYSIAEFLENFARLAKSSKTEVWLAGRLMRQRGHGGLIFGNIQDEGGDVQIALEKNTSGVKDFSFFNKFIDVGDFINVKGGAWLTKRGEPTLRVTEVRLLAKSLRPLPEKWKGLRDPEAKMRLRYLDMLMNPEVHERIVKKSRLLQGLRELLWSDGFLEVETPILQPLYGGANARPFTTNFYALNQKAYLRIAPELYLKRLLVGGQEKIFEIGKNFRNEGIDRAHNPEFLSLELYWAYQDEEGLMSYVERVVERLVKKIAGSSTIRYQGEDISFKAPWERITFKDLFVKHLGLDPLTSSTEELHKKAIDYIDEKENTSGSVDLVDELFKKACLSRCPSRPFFVVDYPISISPLAKQKSAGSNIVRRFQAVIAGIECINGFAELNDPIEQKQRFAKEKERFKDSNKQLEAHPIDDEFIEALEYGMPPAAGVGVGLERLAMIITDSRSLRDVITFPFVKPRSDNFKTDDYHA